MSNSIIDLVCATCGEILQVEITGVINFGFQLFEIAKSAGLYPVMDMNYNRTIIFCCEDCYKKQLTKSGYIRKRLIKVKKEAT